jgi:hypothetical protein
MAQPDRCVQQTDARAERPCDIGLAETLGVEVLRGAPDMDPELLKFSTDVLVNVVRASDETSSAALADPLTPDVILGVPPPVVLRRFDEAEPPFDHCALAAGHCCKGGNVELAIREPRVA